MDIDILCKVVDNYGDIGFAYRLARSLSERADAPRLRLVVDDLAAFALLDPAVDPGLARQEIHGWELFRWGEAEDGPAAGGTAATAFRARRPKVVLECFACGRPSWLEDILFDPSGAEECLVVDIEHLTAEAYAEDFHRMPSLTRSPRVRKAIFLPGFNAATGGLVLDKAFARARARASSAEGRRGLRRELLGELGVAEASPGEASAGETATGASVPIAQRFWVCAFGYERDYGRIVGELAAFAASPEADRPILLLAAAGRSQACVQRAWTAAGRPFPLIALPFLPQESWDALLLSCDFSIVRGEDSWARAALSGRPFLWQAYPQEGKWHLVKVRAFLERLRPCFREASPPADAAAVEAFSALEGLYLAFNERLSDSPSEPGREEILPVLSAYTALQAGFSAFAKSLDGLPDLGSALLTFLREIV